MQIPIKVHTSPPLQAGGVTVLRVIVGLVFLVHGLQKLLRAVRYRDRPHDILQVDARALLKRHLQDVTLTDQNSGSVISKRMRGRDTFVKVGEFRARWVTEVAVEHSVPDVADLTLSVEEWKADSRLRSIWSKGSA